MSSEKKNKTWLAIDSGLYLELASGLSKTGDRVYYYTDWASSFFPKYEEYAIGMGFPGIEKCLYFWDKVDEADAIFCPDVHNNDMIAWIRKHFPDKPCFGSGQAEKLENDRWGLKKILKQIGLPVQKSIKLKGVHALCDYIQKNPDCYVKCDIWRGSINSFYAKDYKSVELLMEDWEHSLGIYSEDFTFVVEEAIHTDNEWGFDGFFSGGEYTDHSFFGVETGKDSYIGRCVPTMEVPNIIMDTMNKFKPVFKELDYRSAVSSEQKIVDKKTSYFLDLCARSPNPLGLLYPEYIENWPEMCYDIACGKPAKLACKAKYVGCVPLYSKHVRNNWVTVSFDQKYKSNVKFMTSCKKDGNYVAVKGSPEDLVAVAVAGEQTLDALIKKLTDVVGNIDAYEIDKNAISGLSKIKEITKNAEAVGISF